MRHFRIFRPSFGLILRMLAGVAACAVSSSCTDDTFDKHGQQGFSGMLAFDVAAPGSWADGSSATRAADSDISIREITQTGGGKPLYLVTEIAEAAVDTAASNAITRGTTTTEETFKDHSFGLSAICYTGEWPGEGEKNEWTTNFAHNLEVKCDGQGTWKSKKPLYWVGSGNIKFFAYSPYSALEADSSGNADSSESSEEGAADAGDATPSVIHSGADAQGVPTLAYTVPTDVTEQIDLMYATADCGGNGTGDVLNGAVNLKFKHALTAVTIKNGKKMLAGTVKSIEISGVHGSGIYPIGTEEWKTTDKAECTFSIDEETILDAEEDDIMTGSDTDLNPDDDGYTFMMIPQTLSDDATLTISFTDNLTNTDRTLTAKLKDFTKDGIWEIGKQYTYSINTTGIVIEPVIELTVNRENTLYPNGGYKGTWSADNPHPDVESLYTAMGEEEKDAYLPVSGILNDVNITAYMKVVQAQAESEAAKEQIRKLDFTIEWSIDGGKTWSSSKDSPELGWKPATGSQSRADDTDPMQPVSGSIILPAQSQFTYMRDFLYGKGTTIEGQTPGKTITDAGNGSKDDPYDLVNNNDVKESANCYIVNNHGYYKFPAYYGNTYNKGSDTSSYKYVGDIDTISDKTRDFVLDEFVKHDNNPVTSGEILGIEDAILLWQDSPDLVTEVKYDNDWVSFRVPEESINQGNAVIAVRNSEGILWSWHIWVTHRKWDNSSCHTMSNTNQNEFQKPFIIAPCNLGYCEPHDKDDERDILIRFVANSEQVGDNEITLTVKGGASQPGKDEKKGIITFTQPEIAASAAGDNTYYQWGRKDPMLPGIHNSETYIADKELDMVNKMFYSTEKYRFTSSESAKSIGESIRFPYQFFMHQRPPSDNATEQNKIDNYKRRHWHNGENTSYEKKAVMNYWNTQLTASGNANFVYGNDIQDYKQSPNDKYVIKTIYDPSPAGFKIPPIKAFADFFDDVKLQEVVPNPEKPNEKETVSENQNAVVVESVEFTGWTITVNDRTFYFPATGVRDMGVKERKVSYGTFPGFSSITYIATSGFHGTVTYDENAGSSCLILAIDKREGDFKNCTYPIHGTNNAYGFTVRPIRDGQTGD